MAAQFNLRPSLRRYLRCRDGWINFAVGFQTDTGSVTQSIRFRDGRVRVAATIPGDVDVVLRFANDATLREMLASTPNESLTLILRNRMIVDGNLAFLQAFNFFVSLLLGKRHQRMLDRAREQRGRIAPAAVRFRQLGSGRRAGGTATIPFDGGSPRRRCPMVARPLSFHVQPGGLPATGRVAARAFRRDPRDLRGTSQAAHRVVSPQRLRDRHVGPAVESRNPPGSCIQVLDGAPRAHHRRELAHRRHVDVETADRRDHLPRCAGSDDLGRVALGREARPQPLSISPQDLDTLHDVFPYWAKRNFREWVRRDHGNPLCLAIDTRWAFYFVWKSVGISHTVPDFRRLLQRGTDGVRATSRRSWQRTVRSTTHGRTPFAPCVSAWRASTPTRRIFRARPGALRTIRRSRAAHRSCCASRRFAGGFPRNRRRRSTKRSTRCGSSGSPCTWRAPTPASPS